MDRKFTVYPNTGHADCWIRAYATEGLFNWFLSHTKKRPPFTVTSSHNSADAHLAIDNDPNTRWHTKTAAIKGQWFQVDFGRTINLEGIVLDARGTPDEMVCGYKIFISKDGTAWERAKGAGRAFLKPRMIIAFGHRKARYLKIVQLGNDQKRGWSIHELDVHYD